MSEGWEDEPGGGARERKRWYDERNAQIARRSQDETKGRDQFDQSIRTGAPIRAGTLSEIRALGASNRQAISGEADPSPTEVSEVVVVGKRPAPGQIRLPEPVRAAGSGFADEFTFGLADPALAVGDVLFQGGPNGFRGRYHNAMEAKRAADADDAAQHPLARNAGRVAGLGASVLAMGLPAVERAVVGALPQGARVAKGLNVSKYGLDRRGLTRMAVGGGGVAGVAAQGISDAFPGRRSSFDDYVASGLGGMADGAATLRLGPAAGGAVGGAATVAAGDFFKRQRPTAEQFIDSAHFSALLGQVGGTAGAYRASTLSPKAKGELGELMTDVKTSARGDGLPFNLRKRFDLENGRHTFTDSQFYPAGYPDLVGVNEAKLGPKAEITPRQIEARRQLGPHYVLDGWRFSDVGKASGAALSPFGAQLIGENGYPWSNR